MSDPVADQFQQYLGRTPNSGEASFFNDLITKGQISPYEVGQVLAGHPEAQANRLNQYGQQYSDKLAASDNQILGKAANAAQSLFAQNGRPDSSGVGAQVLSAGQDLAANRQSMLASFYGQGYQGLQNQYQNNGQNAIGRAYGLGDQQRQWAHDQSNYFQQQNDFNNYLKGQQTRNMQSGLFNAAVSLPGQALAAAGQASRSGF